MEKKNNLVVNTNPATKATTALTGKENVMKNFGYYNETEAAVEGVLLNSILGCSVPLITAFTQRLEMAPAEVAFLVAINHGVTCAISGIMLDSKGKVAKTITATHLFATSALTGMGLFRCLVEGISNGLPVDYASLPAFVVTSATVALSFAIASAFASTAKK